MKKVRQCFISFIISYKVRKKTYLLRCTTNQVGTGYKLHFQPKNPARAKLAAINNKNDCGTDEVYCIQLGGVSYYWYYHIISGRNKSLLRCTANQVSTGHKLHFQHKNPSWATLAATNNKNGCDIDEVCCRQFWSISYHLYYHIRSGKIQLWSLVPPTKSAQARKSIFSLKA